MGKPERKIPLGRPQFWQVDNIKMDLGEKGWGGMDGTHLAQDMDQWWALVYMIMNFWIP
jgi:hypothetical protein